MMISMIRIKASYLLILALAIILPAASIGQSVPLASSAQPASTILPESEKASGSLTVKLKPQDARTDGARWRVDGGPWRNSGDLIEHIDVGVHELSFKKILGWGTPSRVQIFISEGELSDVTVKYRVKHRYVIDLGNGVFLVMVRVSPGSFLMGRDFNEQGSIENEDPQHGVTLAYRFWMSKYEITKAQWEAVMGTAPWIGRNQVIYDPNSPAVYVSWHDAKQFLDALNQHIFSTRQGVALYRLPSESEWEYACRAETSTRFYWGDDPDYNEIDFHAWWGGNAWDVGERYAHKVGYYPPNDSGLHDMSGNVWEWCEDHFHEDYNGAPSDGSAWISVLGGKTRVIRGGSWPNGPAFCRSASRGSNIPSGKNSSLGFRIVN